MYQAPLREGMVQAKTGRLHPLVYKIIAGVLLWSALAAWAVIHAPHFWLAAIAVAVLIAGIAALPPYNLWRHGGDGSFHRWAETDVELDRDRVSGSFALKEAMLPLLAPPVILTCVAIAERVHLDVVLAHLFS